MSDKITVNVSFRSEVSYSKFVEMTREQFDAINARLDAVSNRETARLHEDLFEELGFDLNDVSDYDEPELDDFAEIKP